MPEAQPGFQRYDPNSAAPYQAPVMPDPTPAMPSPLPSAMPEANGAVKHSGAIATVADGILRGFMTGRAYHQAKQVMTLKKKTDDLQNSYNQDATRLYQLHQAGVDPNSDEYKAAKSSVDGSWGALMDFYKGHLEPQDSGKKKSKMQKIEGGIMGMLQSKDPMQQSQAWYQVAQKAGPPVYGQIAMINTPQAKAQREAQTINAQTSVTAAQNTQTATGQQTTELQHAGNVQQAQATIDTLNKTPRNQWTPAMQQQYEQASQIVTPVEAEKPGQQAQLAVDALVKKKMENPSYEFTESDKQIFRAAKIDIDPKEKVHVTSRGEIISEGSDGTYKVLRGPQAAYMPRGGGGGADEDKVYRKWDNYYKEHSPDLTDDERKALVRRKVEGAGQDAAGQIAHDAIAEPKQFDNDVLTSAIDKLRALPQYKDMKTFDNAIANIVGVGDNGYQYHDRAYIDDPAHKPNGGKYSGDVDESQLKNLERDLQTQIRTILTGPKLTGMSPATRRAVMGRMQPLFGPAAAPQGSGSTAASPQPKAAPQPASPASSPGGQGSGKPSKGIVKKSAFLKENPGTTKDDWEAIKPQLTSQGFEVKDE